MEGVPQPQFRHHEGAAEGTAGFRRPQSLRAAGDARDGLRLFPDRASVMSLRDAIRRARVLVVGDVMLDRYWFGDVSRISPEAPVPVVHVTRNEDRIGGAGNVARNAAALGAQVTLLSVAGRDEAGQALRALLDAEPFNVQLHEDPDYST